MLIAESRFRVQRCGRPKHFSKPEIPNLHELAGPSYKILYPNMIFQSFRPRKCGGVVRGRFLDHSGPLRAYFDNTVEAAQACFQAADSPNPQTPPNLLNPIIH